MARLFNYCLLVTPNLLHAQKEIYIHSEWQQPNGLNYSLEYSVQSHKIIVFRGPFADNDPTQSPKAIAFDPQQILNIK